MDIYYIQIILIILFISIFSLPEFQQNRKYLLISEIFILMFCLVIAFRPLTVADSVPYKDFFNFIPQNVSIFSSGGFNYGSYYTGYVKLNQIVKFLFPNNFRMLFLSIILINTYIIWFATGIINKQIKQEGLNKISVEKFKWLKRDSILVAPFFALYLSYYGYYSDAVILRAGLAFSFIYLSFSLFVRKQFIYGILCLIMSILFHQTAILGLLVISIFFIKNEISKKVYYVYLFILLFFYVFKVDTIITSAFSDRMTNFLMGNDIIGGSKFIGYLGAGRIVSSEYSIRLLVLMFNIFISVYYKLPSKTYNTLLNINIVGVSISVFLGNIMASSRVSDFFLFFSFSLFYFVLINIKNLKIRYLFFLWIVFTNLFFVLRFT